MAGRSARRRLFRRQLRGRGRAFRIRRRRAQRRRYEAIEEVENYPDLCQDSHFEYGTRAGWRRIVAALAEGRAPATISACGRAVERFPWLAREAVDLGHEVACHAWRWERHTLTGEGAERQAIARTVQAIRNATGVTPVDWHTRSAPSVNTRRLSHTGRVGERCVDTPIPHNGMLSCFFQGFSSFLLRSMARARDRRLRVV